MSIDPKTWVRERAEQAVANWENYAKGELPEHRAGINRIQKEFAPVISLIIALQEIAKPALGGKMQQYRAQEALAKLEGLSDL